MVSRILSVSNSTYEFSQHQNIYDNPILHTHSSDCYMCTCIQDIKQRQHGTVIQILTEVRALLYAILQLHV